MASEFVNLVKSIVNTSLACPDGAVPATVFNGIKKKKRPCVKNKHLLIRISLMSAKAEFNFSASPRSDAATSKLNAEILF